MCKVKLYVVWCNSPSVASKGGLELFLEYGRIIRNDIVFYNFCNFSFVCKYEIKCCYLQALSKHTGKKDCPRYGNQ